jgi:hypothetical protein
MPFRLAGLHLQQHGFHAIGEHRLGQAPKILKGFEQTADHGRSISSFGEGHKAHPRVAQDRRKAKELMHLAVLFVDKLAPIKLHLLAWFGLKAHDGPFPHRARAPGPHQVLEDADLARIAQRLQALEERFTVVEMVDFDPAAHLVAEGVELRGTPGPRFGSWRSLRIFAHRIARQP